MNRSHSVPILTIDIHIKVNKKVHTFLMTALASIMQGGPAIGAHCAWIGTSLKYHEK